LRAFEARAAPCRLAEGVASKKRQGGTFLWLAGERQGDAVTWIAARCLALRDLALGLGLAGAKARLFVVAPASDPEAAQALFGFVRSLANEFPAVDFRRVEFAAEVPRTAELLAAIVLSDSVETDFSVAGDDVRVLRYAQAAAGAAGPDVEAGAPAGRREGKRIVLQALHPLGLATQDFEGGERRRGDGRRHADAVHESAGGILEVIDQGRGAGDIAAAGGQQF